MFKRIRQTEIKDCGPACLATIVNLSGGKLSLVTAKELTKQVNLGLRFKECWMAQEN